MGGVAVMPLGTDLLSKFRKDKTKEEGTTHQPVADVSMNIYKISFFILLLSNVSFDPM